MRKINTYRRNNCLQNIVSWETLLLEPIPVYINHSKPFSTKDLQNNIFLTDFLCTPPKSHSFFTFLSSGTIIRLTLVSVSQTEHFTISKLYFNAHSNNLPYIFSAIQSSLSTKAMYSPCAILSPLFLASLTPAFAKSYIFILLSSVAYL